MLCRKSTPALLALLLTLQIFPSNAYADDVSRREKVEQLFKLTHLEQTYGQIMTQVMAQTQQVTKQMFPDGAMTDAQKKELADFNNRATALVENSISWESMKPEYVKLYADVYTEDELDGIIAFYSSPVGQAMLTKTPALLKASSEIAMNRMTEIQPKMRQLIEDFSKQVQVQAEQKGTGKSQ
jgi:hypothetical protein